ncbi:MAG: CARDB domain-containing protein, partial [Candidatus Natronoplasma sp.]
DDTFWWYVVRAVGENGVEEEDIKAEQEPVRPFQVEIDVYDDPAIKGQEFLLDYTVTNIGDGKATQTIVFTADRDVKEDEEVTLEEGQNHHGNFTWIPEELGANTLKIASDDHSDGVTVSVIEDANFEISIRELDREVIEGDSVFVRSDVENTGEVKDTQRIRFSVDGDMKDEKEVTLEGGDNETVELSWETEKGYAGRYEIEVTSQDDKEDGRVEVFEADIFAVDIRPQERELVEGEEVVVNYTVRNTKEEQDTQDIKFTVYHRDEVVHEEVKENLTISEREYHEDTFQWQTEEGDAGRYVVEVSSQDDKGDSRISVFEADIFAVEISLRDREVAEGEELTVNYTVRNTKEEQDSQEIKFIVYEFIGSDEEEIVYEDVEESVTIPAGEKHEGSFTWQTEEGDHRLVIASEDDEDDTRITVFQSDIFAVSMNIRDREVSVGEEVVIEYTVFNTKEEEATQDIKLTVYLEDEVVLEDVKNSVTISAGEKYEGEFILQTEELEDGIYEVQISSDDHSEIQMITVGEPEEKDEELIPDLGSLLWVIVIFIIAIIIAAILVVKGFYFA